MSDIQVSLFGSCIHTEKWPAFLKQFESNDVNIEIVLAGPNPPDFELPKNVKFIHVYPDLGLGPCCQVAANHCEGETLFLVGDDCLYSPHIADKLYARYKESNDYKCMPCARWCATPGSTAANTHEELIPENDITDSYWQIRQIPGRTDIYYAFGLWSRKFFDELGGYDRRFVIAPYDADMQLRAFQRGGWHSYVMDAFLTEPLGPENRAWNRWNGQLGCEQLLFGRWYSNGQFQGGYLLPEPRTPFEPFLPGELP